MDDLERRLKELPSSIEGIPRPPMEFRSGTVRRIRTRQVMNVFLSGALVVALAVGGYAGVRWATGNPARQERQSEEPLSPASASLGPVVSVRVGEQTWTLSSFADSEGTGIKISGSPEPNEGVISLPIQEKLLPLTFANPLSTDDWAVLGLVTSEASRVVIEFDDGRTVEGRLFALPSSVSTTLRAFAIEGTGSVVAHLIRALDESGQTVATEIRPAIDPDPSS
jgi:hypothetical protein